MCKELIFFSILIAGIYSQMNWYTRKTAYIMLLLTIIGTLFVLQYSTEYKIGWRAFNSTIKGTMFPGHIAVLIPFTTRTIKFPSLNNISLTTLCIPSIKDTCEPTFQYRVYIGTEEDDYLVTQFDTLRALSSASIQIIPVVVTEGGTLNKVANAIAIRAYIDGAEYFTRICDDTKFITKNWTSLDISTLKSYKPRNVGVVGPTCRQGNTAIMTHEMVHRTHLDIFKYYYPPAFENWYQDDWITLVYMPNRSTKLKTREVVHTMQHGTRYKVDQSRSEWLKPLLILGKFAINLFFKENFSEVPSLRYGLQE